jgi:hypothetical protein
VACDIETGVSVNIYLDNKQSTVTVKSACLKCLVMSESESESPFLERLLPELLGYVCQSESESESPFLERLLPG